MTLRSTSVNLGNPGAIGGTTPGAITGTTITATEKFVASSGTITADAPALNSTQTWNNAGVTFTGYKINITDTASAGGSLLMDLQVGGVSQEKTDKSGNKTLTGKLLVANGTAAAVSVGFSTATGSGLWNRGSGVPGIAVNGTDIYSFGASTFSLLSTSGAVSINGDAVLTRDAANTFAQRNGTAAQTRRLSNTHTDASNYERLTETWSSNVCYTKTEAAGTGTLRQYIPVTNPVVVASLPSAATAGSGARSMVTDANATTFASIVAGGGANTVPVYSDGTNWRIG